MPPSLLIPDLAEYIESLDAHEKVAIDYVKHSDWGLVAGLMLELKERGVESCTTWSYMGFLYTPERICPPNTLPSVKLLPSKFCGNSCLNQEEAYGLYIPGGHSIQMNQKLTNEDPHLLFFNQWYAYSGGYKWSEGKHSLISFYMDQPSNQSISGLLKLKIKTFGSQRVTIFMNGIKIYSDEREISNQILEISFKKDLLKNGRNILSFDLPDAMSPLGLGLSEDKRILAISFESLEIN